MSSGWITVSPDILKLHSYSWAICLLDIFFVSSKKTIGSKYENFFFICSEQKPLINLPYKKSIDEYFGRDVAKMIVKQPLALADVEQNFDIDVKVNGGGSFGQDRQEQ